MTLAESGIGASGPTWVILPTEVLIQHTISRKAPLGGNRSNGGLAWLDRRYDASYLELGPPERRKTLGATLERALSSWPRAPKEGRRDRDLSRLTAPSAPKTPSPRSPAQPCRQPALVSPRLIGLPRGIPTVSGTQFIQVRP